MKFIVSSSELLKKLQQVSGVIQSHNVVPILEDFLFKIEDSVLHIKATDLETTLSVSMPVEAKENGAVCIPSRILLDSLKNLADQPLTMNINKDFVVEITSESGKYKIPGGSMDDYPKEPDAEGISTFTIDAGTLLRAIQKTLFAVSNDDYRPAMTGVYFDLSPDGMQCVATDAHRLVRYKRSDVEGTQTDSFVVPKKPLTLMKSAIPETHEDITVSYNDKHLFVTQGTTRIICRLIDARFPDYKVVIPPDNPYLLRVNKADFAQALRRVSLFSNKSTNQVVLDITGSEMTLQSQDLDFSTEGKERMACQYEGEDIKIAFNARFLIEILSAADSEEVVMELSMPTKAGIIKPVDQEDGEDLLMLAMPLMVNN